VIQRGQTLQVGLDPDPAFGAMNATLEAEITMPSLARIEASGASQVTISGFDSQSDLTIQPSGAGAIEGEISAGNSSIEASGASDVSLSGDCNDLALELSGASSAVLEDFPASDVWAVLSGASCATVNLTGTLDAEASGASHLTYLGSPTLGSVQTSGASTIEER